LLVILERTLVKFFAIIVAPFSLLIPYCTTIITRTVDLVIYFTFSVLNYKNTQKEPEIRNESLTPAIFYHIIW
jgi:hypothetical protein